MLIENLNYTLFIYYSNFHNFSLGKHSLIKIIANTAPITDTYFLMKNVSLIQINNPFYNNLIITEESVFLIIKIWRTFWNKINSGLFQIIVHSFTMINSTIIVEDENFLTKRSMPLFASENFTNFILKSCKFVDSFAILDAGSVKILIFQKI